MPATEEPIMHFRRISPEIDERGNLSASAAFEMAKQVGDQAEVFWLGVQLVQKMSWRITTHDNTQEESMQRFRALIASVLALGENLLTMTHGGDIPAAVQYLRDVCSRHRPGMDQRQADAILGAVFHGQAA